jgi:hypothetical protein
VRRRLFNFAAAVSLLLCGIILLFWIRSYWFISSALRYGDTVSAPQGREIGRRCWKGEVLLAAGSLQLNWVKPYYDDGPPHWEFSDEIRLTHYFSDRSNDPQKPPGALGFGWRHITGQGRFRSLEISSPVWFIALLAAVLPCWRVLSGFNRSRQIAGSLCVACNYNLTGNTSGTCPECGTSVPKAPAEKSPRQA